MEAYTSFAAVYDTFMDNVPYAEWGEYLYGLLNEYGIASGMILDLGCGTGAMTEYLAGRGYDMIGVDNSEEMLEIALEKKLKSGHDILYLCQDMREFELYGTVRAIVSICDSVNYITEPEELRQVFHWVNNYLDLDGVFIFDFNTEYKYREILGERTIAESREECREELRQVFHWVNNYLDLDGVFIFDFNTEYKYREILGERTIAESREECSFIWDNYYYEEEKINEYELSIFVREEELSKSGQDIYRRYQETHFQRGYTLEEVKVLLDAAGMQLFAAYDAFTKEAPTAESERIYIIAGKETAGEQERD